MGKSWLKLEIAHLVIAREALRAATAATNKGQCDTVTHLPVAHILAYGCHAACKLMPRYVRRGDVWIVAHPTVPIAAAKAGGHDLDDNAIRSGGRIGHRLYSDGGSEFLVNGRFHTTSSEN
jgi:hypothetical protein